MQFDAAITLVTAGDHWTTVEFFDLVTENRFVTVRDPNFPLALILRRTAHVPFDFVVNLPFFREHAPETLQDFTPLEFVDARAVIDTLVDGRRVLTFQVILGEVAAVAGALINTELTAMTVTKTFALRTIILQFTSL
jgi:hypothetical protein